MKEPPFPGNGSEKSLAKEKAKLSRLEKELRVKDFYSRLEVGRSATKDEIRRCLRKFSQFHPGDKPPELQKEYEQIFKLYTEAVFTLRNEEERRKYDAQLAGNNQGPAEPTTEQPEPSNPFRSERGWYAGIKQKQAAFRDILGGLNSFEMGTFVQRRDEWIRKGVVTKTEVHNDSRVKEYALKNILIGIYFGVAQFASRRNDWIGEGIVTREEINRNPQVKEIVIENILNGLPAGAKEFANRRDGWAREGIVTEGEINSNPEVRRHALNNLQGSSSEGVLKERLNEWKQARVLTEADAAGIRL